MWTLMWELLCKHFFHFLTVMSYWSFIMCQFLTKLLLFNCLCNVGLSRSNYDLRCLPSINSVGDLPVVPCGVSLCINNNLESFCFNVPSINFLKLHLKACTAHSTIPFNNERYGVTRMWWIPCTWQYDQNSSEEICEFEITVLGNQTWNILFATTKLWQWL